MIAPPGPAGPAGPAAPAQNLRHLSPLLRDDRAFQNSVNSGYTLSDAEDRLRSIKPNIFELQGLDSFAQVVVAIMPDVQKSAPIIRWGATNDSSSLAALANAATLRTRLTSSFLGDYTPILGFCPAVFIYSIFLVCLVFASIKFDFSFLTCARVAVIACVLLFCVAGRSRLRGCHVDDILMYHPLAIAYFFIMSRHARTREGLGQLRDSALYHVAAFHNAFAFLLTDPATLAAQQGMTLNQVRDMANKFATELQGYLAIEKGDDLFQKMAGQPADVKASMMKYACAMKYIDTPAARRFCDRYRSWAFRFSYN